MSNENNISKNNINNNMIYRSIKSSDFKYLRKIICEAWNLNCYSKNSIILNILLQHYLYRYLSIQNYVLVAEINDIPVGFIIGRNNLCFDRQPTAKYKILTRLFDLVLHFTLSGRIYLHNMKRIEKADRQMLQGHSFDGELVLFAVDSKYRGKGIGKHLLQEFKSYSKKNGSHNMYLFTDDYSDVSYYRKRNYEQIEQTFIHFSDEENESSFYLFSFKI